MSAPTLLVPGKLAGAAGAAHPDVRPVDYVIGWLKKRMPEFGGKAPQALADRVLIVRSETGSGKSTVLPAHVLRLLRSEKTPTATQLLGPGVICTQPRILTAKTLAWDLAGDAENYPDLVMGVTVGYQTGPANQKPESGLIYATAGSLLQQLRVKPDSDIIARYRFIIVDEAHERSLDIDTLLMRLKMFLRRNLGNPRLPFVLLASATLPVRKYARYFETDHVIEVEGRAFEVERFFPPRGTNNYVREAARVALELHEKNPDDPPERADILIFMPGGREIEEVVSLLSKAGLKYRTPNSKIRPFTYLAISREVVINEGPDYHLIKADPAKINIPLTNGQMVHPARRIIISTVVAETGVTIETLKYVIDCGWSRTEEVYYPGEFRGIITRPAPQSRIKQRMGRAGRKFPGEFYPLYTKNIYEMLPAEQPPDVITEGILPVFLDIVEATILAQGEAGARAETFSEKTRGEVFRVGEIDMLDPPPVDALAEALERAVVFGYLRAAPAENGHALTRLGAAAARGGKLGMTQMQTIFAGYLWRVSIRDLALIVALYDERGPPLFAGPSGEEAKGDEIEAARRKALRACLPDYLVSPPAVLGGAEDRPPSESEEFYFRARLLISDDFIESLLVFEGFVRALDRHSGDLGALLDWCKENGVHFDGPRGGALSLARKREEVIENLLAAGLNPFWGEEFRLADAPPETFFETVVRLKRCIFAGLRFSALAYDPRAGRYRARAGHLVGVPPAYTDAALSRLRGLGATDALGSLAKPQRLVTNMIRLKNVRPSSRGAPPPLLYDLAPGLVSVLDGYVAVDNALEDPVSPEKT